MQSTGQLQMLEVRQDFRGPFTVKKWPLFNENAFKTHFRIFFLTFRTFFETSFGLLGAGPGRLFWRLFGFWPRDSLSQLHGKSRKDIAC